jgi:hypothetical protein
LGVAPRSSQEHCQYYAARLRHLQPGLKKYSAASMDRRKDDESNEIRTAPRLSEVEKLSREFIAPAWSVGYTEVEIPPRATLRKTGDLARRSDVNDVPRCI